MHFPLWFDAVALAGAVAGVFGTLYAGAVMDRITARWLRREGFRRWDDPRLTVVPPPAAPTMETDPGPPSVSGS